MPHQSGVALDAETQLGVSQRRISRLTASLVPNSQQRPTAGEGVLAIGQVCGGLLQPRVLAGDAGDGKKPLLFLS